MSAAPSASSPDKVARQPPSRARSLARWVPVALWATCIWWFSGEAFSAQSTHNYIDPALRFLFGDLSLPQIRFAHSVIRKTAHFLEYGILAILLYRAIVPPGVPARPKVLVATILYCALYASADELHQTFERNRTGSGLDVLIDVVGATSGALLIVWRRAVRTSSRAPTARHASR